MDGSTVNPILVIGPIIAGIVILGVLGWRREMARRKRRADQIERTARIASAHIPEGASYICSEAATRAIRGELVGSFMLIAIGTFGLNQLGRLLMLLQQCGLEQLVGSILVIENDQQLRNQFRQRVPSVFHDRMVYGFSSAYSGGMANKPVGEVLTHIDVWGVPIDRAATEVIDTHLRRNTSRAPSDIFVFLSLGGQAPLGLPVLHAIRERFEETMIVGFTSLPKHERLRERYGELKPRYEHQGVHGWVLEDNLGPDPVTTDYGMVALIVALSDAALQADQATMPNNTFSLAFTRAAGAVLIYQVIVSSTVGYAVSPDPSQPTRYYAFMQAVVDQVTKSLRRIEQGKGVWSADLPVGEEGTSTFDIVMTSLYPAALREVEDDVNAGRKLRIQYTSNGHVNGSASHDHPHFGRANYESPFASIATAIDPAKPICPIIVVRLMTVWNGNSIVDEIIKVPQLRSLTATSQRPSLVAVSGPSTNGNAGTIQTTP